MICTTAPSLPGRPAPRPPWPVLALAAEGPAARTAIELTAASARERVAAIQAALDASGHG
jgi:hypothetical protein